MHVIASTRATAPVAEQKDEDTGRWKGHGQSIIDASWATSSQRRIMKHIAELACWTHRYCLGINQPFVSINLLTAPSPRLTQLVIATLHAFSFRVGPDRPDSRTRNQAACFFINHLDANLAATSSGILHSELIRLLSDAYSWAPLPATVGGRDGADDR